MAFSARAAREAEILQSFEVVYGTIRERKAAPAPGFKRPNPG
jgi:hypothetical protein